MLIYLIINTVNGKRYVGQTTKALANRKGQHLYHALHRPKTMIEYAIRKYGASQFHFRVLKRCKTRSELNYWEEHYIRYCNSLVPVGYNVNLPSVLSMRFQLRKLREVYILQRYQRIMGARKQAELPSGIPESFFEAVMRPN